MNAASDAPCLSFEPFSERIPRSLLQGAFNSFCPLKPDLYTAYFISRPNQPRSSVGWAALRLTRLGCLGGVKFCKGLTMNEKKFDPKKLEKLNNPQRLLDIPPDYVWEKLNLEKPGVWVDLGAGTAFFSVAFLQKFKPTKIYACDTSDIMINWVNENISPKYPHIIPIKNAEHDVPLDDGIADLVFMINLHHELDDPALTIAESRRILKPDGKIFVVDWKKKEMPEGPPAKIRFLPEQVKAQLVKAGFKQVDIYNDLQKHFLVVGKKGRLYTAPLPGAAS